MMYVFDKFISLYIFSGLRDPGIRPVPASPAWPGPGTLQHQPQSATGSQRGRELHQRLITRDRERERGH